MKTTTTRYAEMMAACAARDTARDAARRLPALLARPAAPGADPVAVAAWREMAAAKVATLLATTEAAATAAIAAYDADRNA